MTQNHADRKWWKVSFEPRPSPRQRYNVEPSPLAAPSHFIRFVAVPFPLRPSCGQAVSCGSNAWLVLGV